MDFPVHLPENNPHLTNANTGAADTDADGFAAQQENLGTRDTPPSPYNYSQTSPVKQLAPKEVKGTAKQLADSVQNHMDLPSVRGHVDNDVYEHSDNRLNDTQRMSKFIGDFARTPNLDTYVYPLNKNPVALMQLDAKYPPATIIHLASHPGVADGGTTMIEHAVNVSQNKGQHGKVSLEPMPRARDFYSKLGFKPRTAPSKLQDLNPADHTDLWSQDSATKSWSLNRNAGKGYLTGNKPEGDV